MNKQELLEVYRQMVMIRRLEERAAELYQQGKIGGFLHLYIGQEAVSTGLVAARQPQDRMITAYRDHGVAINVGISAKEVIAELLGKATGVSKGKGGSMHMADTEKNFFGGHAIVGAHLPIASGMALGDKYKKTPSRSVCSAMVPQILAISMKGSTFQKYGICPFYGFVRTINMAWAPR